MSIIHNFAPEAVLNALPDPLIILNNQAEIEFANTAFAAMLGYPKAELHRREIRHYLHDQSILKACMQELQNHGACLDQETAFVRKNGEVIPTIKNVQIFENGNDSYIVVNIRNICQIDAANKELRAAEITARELQDRLAQLVVDKEHALNLKQMQLDEVLGSINEIVWYIDDRSMTLQYVSDAVEKVFNIPAERFLSEPLLWQRLIHADDRESVRAFFRSLEAGDSRAIDFRIVRPDGEVRWLNNRIVHHRSRSYFVGVTIDITESKKTRDTIEFMAFHDTLTRLPNRIHLKNRIEALLGTAEAPQQRLSLLFLDLDNFKYINDTLGHEVGDEVLVEVARRLKETLDNNSLCVRFGGDEFIILFEERHTRDVTDTLAQDLIRTFRRPFRIREHEFFISCSVGISCYPEHARDSSSLIKHADTAMYAAKKAGKNRFSYYESAMDRHLQEFLHLGTLIREGIQEGHFRLHYQPLITADTQEVAGFEALLRLFHPKVGSISPSQFIPVAEATGDILPLGDFVLDEACRFIRQVNQIRDTPCFISVNVSSRQFLEESFARNILETLHRHRINPAWLKLELTESVVMENLDTAQDALGTLRKSGVRIALDDFGTGYSSFEYLAKLPIDTVKIDKSFVLGLFDDPSNRHIVEAITSLAHALGKDVTAEGVEDVRFVHCLQRTKIDHLQGFLFSAPLNAKQILQNLRDEKGRYRIAMPLEYAI